MLFHYVRLKSRSPYRGGPRSRSRSDPADSVGEPSRATSNFSPTSIAKTFSISSSSSGTVSAPCPSTFYKRNRYIFFSLDYVYSNVTVTCIEKKKEKEEDQRETQLIAIRN